MLNDLSKISMTDHEQKMQEMKSEIYGAFAAERDGTISKLELSARLTNLTNEIVRIGRVSVLQDFDDMCLADGFVGFSPAEWTAIKKFFAFNKEVSGWDK